MSTALQRLHSATEATEWLRSRVTGTLRTDSRQVTPGDGFIAWPGAVTDGRHHVQSALAQGAAACLVEQDGVDAFDLDGDGVAAMAQLKRATGDIAAQWFGEPSQHLDVLAVTGTNGKTSSAWWLAQSLSNLEQTMSIPCGLVGTLGIGVPPHAGSSGAIEFNGLTTPDPVLLQRHLRRFVDDGLKACAMEASSIGIAEHRLAGTRVRVAVFTNLTQDHLDYHGSMQAYWEAKRALFEWPGLQAAVVNIDDAHGVELAAWLSTQPIDLWTVSVSDRSARLCATEAGYSARGLRFTAIERGASVLLETALIGDYNLSNLLGVLATMRALGVPLVSAVQACTALSPVPGRMDCIGEPGEPMVVVDYAHTPDALEKALMALRPFAQQRGGALWCVFGCGGDRDTTKRPLMARAAEQLADRVVVTSDNPRSEPSQSIIDQIVRGLVHPARAQVEPDRSSAILEAVNHCAAADVLLVAGKGHEAYQEIAGVKHPFSDQSHARQALAQRRGRAC
jgi:UDP-N-acetylmuramyl-tripeptide synthetase